MKKKLTNIQVVLLIGAIIKGLGLIYKIFLTRILTIEGMRILSLIFPSLSLFLCISSLSTSTVVNQNIAAKLQNSRTIVKAAFNITFISSSIISIILMCSFPLYKIIYQNSFIYYPLLICIPLIYLSNTSGILKGYLEANNNFKVTYFSNFYEQVSKFLLTFSMLIIFRNSSIELKIIFCFLAMMLSEVVSFIYLTIKVKQKRKLDYIFVKTNGYEKSILKQALPLTIDQLIITITGYFEPLIFYYAIGLTGVNMYEATIYYTKVSAYAVPLLIFAHFGVLSIAKFVFPKITKYQNTKEIHTILAKAFFLCSIIAAFNLVICFFYSTETLNLMYNDSSSSNIAKNLAFFYIVSYFNPIFIIILQAYKKEKKLLIASSISSIIYLILIFIFTYIWGEKGFLYSIIIANTLKFLLLLFFANRCVHFEINLGKAFCILAIITIYFLCNYFWHSLWCLLASTLICALIALLLYYLFYHNKVKYHYVMKHK